jgi:hypothetical protein
MTGAIHVSEVPALLRAELQLRIGSLSIPLWRTREPAVVAFMRARMRQRLLQAIAGAKAPIVRDWAKAKLNEIEKLEALSHRVSRLQGQE